MDLEFNGTLVALPVDQDDALMPSLLTLTDVMATGHHAAPCAEVGPLASHAATVSTAAEERAPRSLGR